MITLERFKQGLYAYGNDEFVMKTHGLGKWMIALFLPSIVESMCSFILANKSIMMSACFMSDDGMIDIDRIHSELISICDRTGDVVHNLPVLGDVKFSKQDIEFAYKRMI